MPFLTSFGRNIISEYVLQDIDNVYRVLNDGICYSRPQTFDNVNMVPEEKNIGIFNSKSGKLIRT